MGKEYFADLPGLKMRETVFVNGNASASPSDPIFSFYAEKAITLEEVQLLAGTAPVGAALIVDVHDDGTTLWSSSKPQIADGASTGSKTGQSLDIAAGSKIEIFIDQVGSTTAGADISINLIYSYQ